ncbi:chaperone NapD [Roseovarius sp. 2305UL8-3]|uniref:chaperone NapD n=1 Tax=Roseovarius conchicola TaxID=3121636 RepID=UPI003526D851
MLNICGCLVHAMPERAEDIITAINAAEGSEVHAHEDGRIVITVEDTETRRASEQIMELHQIPGVLTISLTYHHFEEAETPDAPILQH